MRVLAALTALIAGAMLVTPAGAATAFDPVVEARNFSITQQRQAEYDTPAYQARLATVGAQNAAVATAAQAKRPGIVITSGSVQADENLYWYAAQALAKAGYVVLTFDPQGQGQSDTLGERADAQEGVPAQTDGRPFYDGTEDALNFFLSSPTIPYTSVPSCQTGTSHAAKQTQRVAAGLDAGYNPLWTMINPAQIGLAGHSYGATGGSYIAQWDKRVKAVVAWTTSAGLVRVCGISTGPERQVAGRGRLPG